MSEGYEVPTELPGSTGSSTSHYSIPYKELSKFDRTEERLELKDHVFHVIRLGSLEDCFFLVVVFPLTVQSVVQYLKEKSERA